MPCVRAESYWNSLSPEDKIQIFEHYHSNTSNRKEIPEYMEIWFKSYDGEIKMDGKKHSSNSVKGVLSKWARLQEGRDQLIAKLNNADDDASMTNLKQCIIDPARFSAQAGTGKTQLSSAELTEISTVFPEFFNLEGVMEEFIKTMKDDLQPTSSLLDDVINSRKTFGDRVGDVNYDTLLTQFKTWEGVVEGFSEANLIGRYQTLVDQIFVPSGQMTQGDKILMGIVSQLGMSHQNAFHSIPHFFEVFKGAQKSLKEFAVNMEKCSSYKGRSVVETWIDSTMNDSTHVLKSDEIRKANATAFVKVYAALIHDKGPQTYDGRLGEATKLMDDLVKSSGSNSSRYKSRAEKLFKAADNSDKRTAGFSSSDLDYLRGSTKLQYDFDKVTSTPVSGAPGVYEFPVGSEDYIQMRPNPNPNERGIFSYYFIEVDKIGNSGNYTYQPKKTFAITDVNELLTDANIKTIQDDFEARISEMINRNYKGNEGNVPSEVWSAIWLIRDICKDSIVLGSGAKVSDLYDALEAGLIDIKGTVPSNVLVTGGTTKHMRAWQQKAVDGKSIASQGVQGDQGSIYIGNEGATCQIDVRGEPKFWVDKGAYTDRTDINQLPDHRRSDEFKDGTIEKGFYINNQGKVVMWLNPRAKILPDKVDFETRKGRFMDETGSDSQTLIFEDTADWNQPTVGGSWINYNTFLEKQLANGNLDINKFAIQDVAGFRDINAAVFEPDSWATSETFRLFQEMHKPLVSKYLYIKNNLEDGASYPGILQEIEIEFNSLLKSYLKSQIGFHKNRMACAETDMRGMITVYNKILKDTGDPALKPDKDSFEFRQLKSQIEAIQTVRRFELIKTKDDGSYEFDSKAFSDLDRYTENKLNDNLYKGGDMDAHIADYNGIEDYNEATIRTLEDNMVQALLDVDAIKFDMVNRVVKKEQFGLGNGFTSGPEGKNLVSLMMESFFKGFAELNPSDYDTKLDTLATRLFDVADVLDGKELIAKKQVGKELEPVEFPSELLLTSNSILFEGDSFVKRPNAINDPKAELIMFYQYYRSRQSNGFKVNNIADLEAKAGQLPDAEFVMRKTAGGDAFTVKIENGTLTVKDKGGTDVTSTVSGGYDSIEPKKGNLYEYSGKGMEYTNPLTKAEFLQLLKADFDQTNKVYRGGDDSQIEKVRTARTQKLQDWLKDLSGGDKGANHRFNVDDAVKKMNGKNQYEKGHFNAKNYETSRNLSDIKHKLQQFQNRMSTNGDDASASLNKPPYDPTIHKTNFDANNTIMNSQDTKVKIFNGNEVDKVAKSSEYVNLFLDNYQFSRNAETEETSGQLMLLMAALENIAPFSELTPKQMIKSLLDLGIIKAGDFISGGNMGIVNKINNLTSPSYSNYRPQLFKIAYSFEMNLYGVMKDNTDPNITFKTADGITLTPEYLSNRWLLLSNCTEAGFPAKVC